jgi:hypothetical protein
MIEHETTAVPVIDPYRLQQTHDRESARPLHPLAIPGQENEAHPLLPRVTRDLESEAIPHHRVLLLVAEILAEDDPLVVAQTAVVPGHPEDPARPMDPAEVDRGENVLFREDLAGRPHPFRKSARFPSSFSHSCNSFPRIAR